MNDKPSIFARVRRSVATQIFPLMLWTRSPFLIAICVGFMAQTLGKGRRVRILTLSKDIFEDDLKALADFGKDIEYLSLSHGTFWQIFVAVAGSDITGMIPANYNVLEKWEEPKRRYRAFLLKMIPTLQRFFKIEVVLACNYTYTSLQELSRAASECGLPYVVLYKEGLLVPGREPDWQDYWKSHFVKSPLGIDRILTLAPSIQSVFTAESIGQVPDEEVRVTGFPRLDYYREPEILPAREPRSDRPLIVIFTFEPDIAFLYFKEMQIEREALLMAMRTRMHEQYVALIEFARKHEEVDMVIKLKRGCPSTPQTLKILEAVLGGAAETSLPANVTATSDWIARDLILDAHMTIGLNSLTGVESVLAGVPSGTPDYDDFFNDVPWSIFSDWPDLTIPFRNFEDLEKLYAAAPTFFDGKEKRREEFLATHAAFGDSMLSSEAVESEILDLVETFELNRTDT